ncbi:SRPBCC family protein [Longimicrobium sp.]|uniref:SRPBCC family protein n=1 Tax=Longimicrobium sp. TaxID=2029185 RepID=UPI002CFBDE2A|nr:SRPBCC family protein [Longimicrobium sp.]HSU16510.1 SRPBCC family protein [Longimicrobium sp.]
MMMTTQSTVYVTYIAATAERVWEALTSPEHTERYFFGRRIESDWKEGSTWTLWMPDGRADVSGRVLRAERPRVLSVSWRVEWIEELRDLPESIVTYTIEPLGDVVRLTMEEAHPTPIPEELLEGGRQGWPMILSGLKTLLETGRALNLAVPEPPATK